MANESPVPPLGPLPQIDGFSLQVNIFVDPSNVEKIFEAMKPCFDEVRKEKELLYFEMFQDPANSGNISWVENWAMSPEKFMATQMTKEYYKPYLETTEPMFVKPREFRILKRLRQPFMVWKEENLA